MLSSRDSNKFEFQQHAATRRGQVTEEYVATRFIGLRILLLSPISGRCMWIYLGFVWRLREVVCARLSVSVQIKP